MVQQLRMLTAVLEDPNSLPCTLVAHTCLSLKLQGSLCWSLRVLHSQAQTITKKKNNRIAARICNPSMGVGGGKREVESGKSPELIGQEAQLNKRAPVSVREPVSQ